MKAVCMSDTHSRHHYTTVPEGDVLIHSGDFSVHGTEREVHAFAQWFIRQPHKHKVVIPGNHDKIAQQYPLIVKEMFEAEGVHYLDSTGVEIEGKLFYGSPWTPTFGYGWAFNADPGEQIKRHWDAIPDDVNVLITHGPPYGILDYVYDWQGVQGNAGCKDLLERLKQLTKLELHVFGHIHAGYGVSTKAPYGISVNPATTITTREGYVHAKEPIMIELS